MRTFKFLAVITLTMLFHWAYAQPGSNDPSFNQGDMGFGSGKGFSSRVHALEQLSNGKIIAVGGFGSYNTISNIGVAQLNPNGEMDEGFKSYLGLFSGTVRSASAQIDNKIIIGGDFTRRVSRMNTDGTIDNTFNPGTGANFTVFATAVQSDQKIIVAGGFWLFNGLNRNRIVRLEADGTVDAGFDPGSGANGTIYSVLLQPDGKIIIAGSFTAYNGIGRNRIARLNSDGSLDNSFDPGTGANNTIQSIALQSDNKIIIGGIFNFVNNFNIKGVARLTANGSVDTEFNTGINSNVSKVIIQPNQEILVGGAFMNFNGVQRNGIARVKPDGSLDLGFNAGLGAYNIETGDAFSVDDILLQSNNEILIGGHFYFFNGKSRMHISRLKADGSNDSTFNMQTGVNSAVRISALQADGRIIIAGDFNSYNETYVRKIARLYPNGILDNSFNPGMSIGNNSSIYCAKILTDNKILIAGDFNSFNGVSRRNIARLHPNGTLDNSFTPQMATNGPIYAMVVQPDNKIIIVGAFSTFNSTPRLGIARLNQDGTLDITFDPGAGAYSIRSVSLQQDGKIIIAGNISAYDNVPINGIARINPSGILDLTFNPGAGIGNSIINCVAIQQDGKIIIGGEFSFFNGVARKNIARLEPDGSLDGTFNPGTGVNIQYPSISSIHTISIQSDEKIIIGGHFSSYNGTSINHLARLNLDGTLDNIFNTGSGVGGTKNSTIYSLTLQQNGKVIIGGWFITYNGIGRNMIARLNTDILSPPAISYNTSIYNGYEISCHGGNNGSIDLTVTDGTPPYTFNWNNGAYTTEDLNGLPAGAYHVIVMDANSATAEETIILNQPSYPLAALGVPSFQGCNGESGGSIFLNVFGGITPYTYNWNNGAYSTQHLSDMSAGSYTVIVTDANGCTTGNTSNISPPDELFLEVTNDTFVFYGTSNPSECVTLNAAAQGGVPYIGPFGAELYVYTMDGNINLTSQTAEVTVCPTSDTYYTIAATDAISCTRSKTILVKAYNISCGNNNDKIQVCINGSQTVCLTESTANNVLANNPNAQLGSCVAYNKQMPGASVGLDVSIAPNPSSGRFTVQYNDGKEHAFAVRVFDITGRVVYQAMQPGSALNMDIDLSAQAEGTYLVIVADGAVVLERTKVVLMGSR